MPVKIWDRDGQGVLTSKIEPGGGSLLGGEDHRTEAEALDAEIDGVLDRAEELSSVCSEDEGGTQQFVRRWATGRAIAESHILQSPHLEPGELAYFWDAMARKCRIGIRSSGEPEVRWRSLIPSREIEPGRIERDVFSVSLWLQEQGIENAMASFGGSLTNVREIRNRESLRSRELRDALGRWRSSQHPGHHALLVEGKRFITIAKALRARWPSKGPGSAERPEHLTHEELDHEIRQVLVPIVDEILSGSTDQT